MDFSLPSLFSFFSVIILIIVGCTSEQPSDKSSTTPVINMELLTGRWQSVKNPKNQIEITPSRIFSYQGDLKLSDEALTVYENCVAWCIPANRQVMPCMITDGKRAENCFEIIQLTKTTLAYRTQGKTAGKTMVFEKM